MRRDISLWAVSLLAIASAACESDGSGTKPEPDAGQADGSSGDGQDAGEATSTIRIHYKASRGDLASWGLQYWGAGTTSPEWGKPPLFTQTDDFGGYIDVPIADPTMPLGFFPVWFVDGQPVKDVETEVLFADLPKSADDPNLAECWITQGGAVQLSPAGASEPEHDIYAAGDFIDLGDGRVRLMFHVPAGSTGSVKLWVEGAEATTLDATWSADDAINEQGLLVDLRELTPEFDGKTFRYDIASQLKVGDETYDAVREGIELTPTAFEPVESGAEWARKAVIYELMVRTFADGGKVVSEVANPASESGIDPSERDGVGDLVGLRNRLDYLRELGVNAIWMTPVFAARSFHGYDPVDFYTIDPAYGTLKDFADLMNAAHCKTSAGAPIADCTRIDIVVDFVVNHVATTTPWFTAALDPKATDHAKYANWIAWADPYTDMFADVHPWQPGERLWHCARIGADRRCYHKIFWSGTPELNLRNRDVRAEVENIAKFWVEGYDVDGFRLDASKHIDQLDEYRTGDVTLQGTHAFWQEFNAFVKGLRPERPVLLAGENRWDGVSGVNAIGEFRADVGGYDDALKNWRVAYYADDMDSQFDFGFRNAVNHFLTGADYATASFDDPTLADYLESLADGVAGSTAQPNPNGNAAHFFERFLSNHDVDRPASLFADLSNEELFARLKLAASLVFTMPGTPVVYYGEEYGKKGRNDGSDSYLREPMEWEAAATFTPSEDGMRKDLDTSATADSCKAINFEYPDIKFIESEDGISVEEQKAAPDSLWAHYQALITLRRDYPVLTDAGATVEELKREGDVYAYAVRTTNPDVAVPELLVAHNRTGLPVAFTAAGTDLLSGEEDVAGSFSIPPYGTVIIRD